MAYFYVKNGGTKTTGSEASLLTGAWSGTPGDYYASIQSAVSNGGAGSGDYVLCAHLHQHDYNTITANLAMPDGLTVLSVDNANRENLLAGAIEENTAANGDIRLITGQPHVYIYGVTFKTDDDFYIFETANAGAHLTIEKGGLIITGSSSSERVYMLGDGSWLELIDSVFTLTSSAVVYSGYDSKLTMKGGSLSLANTAKMLDLIGNCGFELHLNGVDMSGSASGATLCETVSVGLDRVFMELNRVHAPASFNLWQTTPALPNFRAECHGVSTADGGVSTADRYWAHRIEDAYGTLNENGTIYRTAGATYDGTNEFSYEVSTTGNCSAFKPFKFKLANVVVDSADSTSTFTVHFARDDNSGTLLETHEIWLETIRPDATDEALGVHDSTRAAALDNTTDVTNESGGWTGLTGSEGTNHEVMSVNTGALAHGSGVVEVWVCIGVASLTDLHFCPKVEVS